MKTSEIERLISQEASDEAIEREVHSAIVEARQEKAGYDPDLESLAASLEKARNEAAKSKRIKALAEAQEAQQREREIKMFGLPWADFHDSIPSRSNPIMVVASVLSDSQEMIAHGDLEGARQAINRAKSYLFHEVESSGLNR